MMTVTDKNGKAIEVTDLDLAIMQADDYRHYRHYTPEWRATDERLQAYWQHLYEELLKLQAAQEQQHDV